MSWDYGWLLPKKPSVTPGAWRSRELKCDDCPVMFTATAPNQHRCADCQAKATERRLHRSNEKLKRQRKMNGLSPEAFSKKLSGVSGT